MAIVGFFLPPGAPSDDDISLFPTRTKLSEEDEKPKLKFNVVSKNHNGWKWRRRTKARSKMKNQSAKKMKNHDEGDEEAK